MNLTTKQALIEKFIVHESDVNLRFFNNVRVYSTLMCACKTKIAIYDLACPQLWYSMKKITLNFCSKVRIHHLNFDSK